MQRNIRRKIDIGLTGLGIGIIITAVVLGGSLQIELQLPLALLGVLFMEAGVWGLSAKLFPSERRYSKLRREADHMIALVRELNTAAIAKDTGEEDARRFQDALAAMHDSVEKMSTLAGVEDSSQPREEPDKA